MTKAFLRSAAVRCSVATGTKLLVGGVPGQGGSHRAAMIFDHVVTGMSPSVIGALSGVFGSIAHDEYVGDFIAFRAQRRDGGVAFVA